MEMKAAKKKIGILTFYYSNNNYGAVLQAYSILKLVESLGYEAYIINYQPQKIKIKEKIFLFIQKMFGFRFANFRKHYIKLMPDKIMLVEELKELNERFDGFVVGSDQVWRSRIDTKELYAYFLNFVNSDKIKVAYGASFGLDYWEGAKETTEHIKILIARFNAISVREESGVEICRNIFNVDSNLVLDPTMAINKKYFYELVKTNNTIFREKKYIAYMILDDSKHIESHFKALAKKKQLKFVNLKGRPVYSKKGFYFFNEISKWLYLIKNAEIIVTDSFHCSVFSIIFHKKFICLVNPQRGATRLQNLLKIIGEEFRFYTNLKELDEKLIFNEINYERIDKILEKAGNKSLDFLRDGLSKVGE